jgi:mannose/fructose/N-acetylgalactosamine-specific phosphotransferase system component IIB
LVERGLSIPVLNRGNQAFVRGSMKLSNTVFLTESGVKSIEENPRKRDQDHLPHDAQRFGE